MIGDLAAHAQHVVERALRAPRQADVGDVDADLRHEVDELELRLDVRIGDRRVLQAVAQRLVEERHAARDEAPLPADFVPVVDEVGRGRLGAARGELSHAASLLRPDHDRVARPAFSWLGARAGANAITRAAAAARGGTPSRRGRRADLISRGSATLGACSSGADKRRSFASRGPRGGRARSITRRAGALPTTSRR